MIIILIAILTLFIVSNYNAYLEGKYRQYQEDEKFHAEVTDMLNRSKMFLDKAGNMLNESKEMGQERIEFLERCKYLFEESEYKMWKSKLQKQIS